MDSLLAEYCRYELRLDLRGAGEERARKVLALRGLCVAVELTGETSRLGSMDPVADRIKCELHALQEKQDQVVDMVPGRSWWLSQGTRQDRVGCPCGGSERLVA